eukprot:508628-Alexandrium_andersonii.AAC.1
MCVRHAGCGHVPRPRLYAARWAMPYGKPTWQASQRLDKTARGGNVCVSVCVPQLRPGMPRLRTARRAC